MKNSESPKSKAPKWLTIPLWTIGLLTAYVAVSWFWHAKLYYEWVGPFSGSASTSGEPDPFGDPSYPIEIPESLLTGLNKAFYDFPGWYRRATDPFRLRKSPEGKDYFDTNDSSIEHITAHLRGLGEPSLFEREPDDENTYFRFTFVPTFGHVECFRLTTYPGGKNELISLQSHGQGGYTTGKIRQRLISLLDPATAAALIKETKSPQFWNQMTEEEIYYLSGLDGSTWVFELSSPTDYQMMWIDNPFEESDRSADFIQEMNSAGIRLPYDHARLGIRFIERANFGSAFGVESDSGVSPSHDPFE